MHPHVQGIAAGVAIGAVSLSFATAAHAGTSVAAPAGGGLAALPVTVDLAAGRVVAGGVTVPIPIEAKRLPDEAAVTVEDVAIGQGRHVVHVRVPAKDDEKGGGPPLVWEALFAAGKPEPIFAGLTGFADGDPGERTGKAVQILPNGATSFVLVGDVREDLDLCGRYPTLLDPLALYPATLTLRPATVQRLSADEREHAEKVIATAIAPPSAPSHAPAPAPAPASAPAPLARLLAARGSSVPGSTGAELTDGDLSTAWREQRPGIGQGEFVVASAPKGVPIARLHIVPAPPPGGAAGCAAPRTVDVVTSSRVVEVTLPVDACAKPGTSFDVELPEPIDAECVGLVLGGAYAHAAPRPDVGLAEVTAYSEFDAPGATLDDVAKALGGPHALVAQQVLERAGDGALGAVERAYDTLDDRGKALAVDVASSRASCDDAAPLLVRALCEKSGQAPRRSLEKLGRCSGAAAALARRLREDGSSRACVAPVLATLAPAEALAPIADAMASAPEGDANQRAALRGAFATALQSAAAGAVAPLLGDAGRSAPSRLEIMRAAGARVTEAVAQSDATVADLLTGTPTARVRYLVLGPLGELARTGDRAASGRLAEAIARDTDAAVRVRAAEVARPVADQADVQRALVAAVADAEPRVREAALGALEEVPSPEAVRAAVEALGHDHWTFVRLRAMGVLMNAPASGDTDDALGRVLHDAAVRIRVAAALGLGRRRATAWRTSLRDRVRDPDEDAEVRATAATALGSVCDGESVGVLAELASRLADPSIEGDAAQVGFGALVGLAALQPRDLKDRLAPLLKPSAPPRVRSAAEKVLSARGVCKWR
jgi:HEAT repeat protein